MFELLIFDLDGTLVDSSRDLSASANAALRDLGLPERTHQQIVGFVGDGARALMARALPPRASDRIDQALACFEAHYAARLIDTTRLYDGIASVLAELPMPLALATNKPERFTLPLLEALGIRERFSCVLAGDTLAVRKPHPLVIETACQRLGTRPERSLMIGDGPQDMLAARAAGAKACGVSWGFRSQDLVGGSRPDAMAHEPGDLLRIARDMARASKPRQLSAEIV